MGYRKGIASAGDDWLSPLLRMGAEAALCKVQATRCFEHCAREAAPRRGRRASGRKRNPTRWRNPERCASRRD